MPSEISGKAQVIECLENYLKHAKDGRFGSISICMIEQPNIAKMDCVGELNLQRAAIEGLKILANSIDQCIKTWEVPPHDPNLSGNHVVYNMANGPLGFDFLTWLISMEEWRQINNYPSPLKVRFWKGTNEEEVMSELNRKGWLDNVFRPCLKWVGAVEDDTPGGAFLQSYTTLNIVNWFKDPVKPHPVQYIESVKEYDLPTDKIVITLREAEYDLDRNSRLSEWIKFAKDIGPDKVLFVRDTRLADEPIEGFEICPLASKDLDARLWLMNHSKLNMFVSNGPCNMAMFTKKPWITFIQEDNDTPGCVNTKAFWIKNMGIELGDQYPWCTPEQKFWWTADTYEEITKAYESVKDNI